MPQLEGLAGDEAACGSRCGDYASKTSSRRVAVSSCSAQRYSSSELRDLKSY